MSKERIGAVEEFPEDRATFVEVNGIPISVFNLDGEFYAIHDVCPHKNLPLHRIGDEPSVPSHPARDGSESHTLGSIDEENLVVRCPWHNLSWDLETGCNRLRNSAIPTFDVEIENGEVYVEI